MRIGRRRSLAPSRAASSSALPRSCRVLRELDDEDRVLRAQADEHDETDLGEDVVHLAPKPYGGEGAEDGDRACRGER